MSAKAGETAQERGDFVCSKCRNKVHVTRGKKIPKCSQCGGLRSTNVAMNPADTFGPEAVRRDRLDLWMPQEGGPACTSQNPSIRGDYTGGMSPDPR